MTVRGGKRLHRRWAAVVDRRPHFELRESADRCKSGATVKAREIEIDEILPKGARVSAKDDPLIAFLARLMDNQFAIPGTNLRFGLDPLLGLLPGWATPRACSSPRCSW